MTMTNARWVGLWIAAAVMLASVAGCGSRGLGQVTGTVKLDGDPLPDAMVIFTPLTGGRPAAGRTDAQGKYELVFDREGTGAMLGEHVVEITTADETVLDDDTVERIPEKVPAEYNANTELRETIEAGSNVFNFDLKSGGEIITAPEDG